MNAANQGDAKCCIVIPYKDNSPILARCLIPKHKEEATDDIREKGERG